jgi:hypothetical protein
MPQEIGRMRFARLEHSSTPLRRGRKGVVLTSASTIRAMKELLRQSGVVSEHEYDMPHVAARLEPTLDRVRFLRHHPNADYLEPIFPGTSGPDGTGRRLVVRPAPPCTRWRGPAAAQSGMEMKTDPSSSTRTA